MNTHQAQNGQKWAKISTFGKSAPLKTPKISAKWHIGQKGIFIWTTRKKSVKQAIFSRTNVRFLAI